MTHRRLASLLLITLDLVCLIVVFWVVSWLRRSPALGVFDTPALLVPFAVLILVIYLIDGYSARTDMLSLAYTSQHAIALFTGMLVMLLVTFVFMRDQYALQSSRAVIMFSFTALIPLTLAYRRWLTLRTIGARKKWPIVFIGSQASCVVFKESCEKNYLEQKLIFVAIDAADHESVSPLVGMEMQPGSQLFALLDRLGRQIETIVLHESSRDLPFAAAEKLMELQFSGVSIYTLELFHEAYWRKIPLQGLDQLWLFQEGFEITRDPVYDRLKRISDVTFASLGLTLALPVLLLCAAAVWLDDRGPVFFSQTRVGKNRQLFQVYKFRTMRPDEGAASLYTKAHDTRVTRAGRLLRAARLDELPQLWNVLLGDMSLIGPRAEWIKLVERYEKEIPCYHFRHLVKPGITGWAQVNYPYGANIEDTLRKLEYDLYYIRHFSFVLDASIVLKTIHVMLGGKGR
jgi:exopolysaccharide biosynthesis polyprenyl glycosylphosphotransferase